MSIWPTRSPLSSRTSDTNVQDSASFKWGSRVRGDQRNHGGWDRNVGDVEISRRGSVFESHFG